MCCCNDFVFAYDFRPLFKRRRRLRFRVCLAAEESYTNTAHATRRRRAPPPSVPTRPFRTNPARLIPTSREIFSTRQTLPFSLSRLAHRCRTRIRPQTTLPPPSRPGATNANLALHQTPGRKGHRHVGPAHHTAITRTGPLFLTFRSFLPAHQKRRKAHN